MLEEHKDKEMLTLIVRALQKADALQKAMKLSDYKFAGMNMKTGFTASCHSKVGKTRFAGIRVKG